ncbi:MAG: polysaccharide biosynthesis protein [Kiritimatiellia bacterium]
MDFNLESFIKNSVTKRQTSLLAPDFAQNDDALHQALDRARVLVIGGAGTIGSHYIKALLRFPIAKLVVVDISENGLTELVRDLRSDPASIRIPQDFITYPVNFGEPVFKKIFRSAGPFDIVANFAAHKHVRSEKDVFSIEAMVTNNVLQAESLLELLKEMPPKHFFCVSTDKAANPVNVMGASKKLMEELILSYADCLPITTARFANVAFSNGSLPLNFLQRIHAHQPLSCPLGIRRFFVSPIESGELCLFASVMGAPGDILYPRLDTTDLITFDSVLRDLLDTLGLGCESCPDSETARKHCTEYLTTPSLRSRGYPVEFFTSDTSGEKSFEEFHTEGELCDETRFHALGVITNAPRRSRSEMAQRLADIKTLFARPTLTKSEIVFLLEAALPMFHHIEKGRGLDARM